MTDTPTVVPGFSTMLSSCLCLNRKLSLHSDINCAILRVLLTVKGGPLDLLRDVSVFHVWMSEIRRVTTRSAATESRKTRKKILMSMPYMISNSILIIPARFPQPEQTVL